MFAEADELLSPLLEDAFFDAELVFVPELLLFVLGDVFPLVLEELLDDVLREFVL